MAESDNILTKLGSGSVRNLAGKNRSGQVWLDYGKTAQAAARHNFPHRADCGIVRGTASVQSYRKMLAE
jgi:hypothetical protein